MTQENAGIIYHNYPQSPVAEKVRVAFGIKGLHWHNVEIPRLPPKPMLTTLTGGYRRTPVMQIGADIYCDSQCIIRELERRHPSPSFMPTDNGGLMWCMSRWTDGALFDLSVKIVLGSAGDNLPADFAEDRGRLYLGENWAEGLKQANAELPHLVAQLRAPLSWLNQQLSDGRKYLLGEAPAAVDAQMYHVLWFVNGRWDGGPSLIGQFPHVQRWMESVNAIGHGTQSDMTPEAAVSVAQSLQTITAEGVAEHDPQGLVVGQRVFISPDVNGGEQAVEGRLRMADADTIAIDRVSDTAEDVCVHFPRSGYRIDTTING
ncbi:MAG: glutathione S-transferase family protein [Granulosicoccus sp.]